MKVLHIFKTYYPDTYGGIEEVIYQLVTHSADVGVHAEVFTLSKEVPRAIPEDFDGHLVHRIKRNFEFASTTFSWSAFNYFRKLSREFDLIHYHFPWPAMDLLHFYANHGKPSVVTYQSDIIKQKMLLQLYKPLQQRFLSNVQAIVATTPNYVNSSPVLGQYLEKITIIPNGIEPVPLTDAIKERIKYWETTLSGPFFLFVGALRYYKGLDTLLEAATKVPYPVIIAGAGFEEANLKQIARTKGLTNVMFVGAISEEDKHALLYLSYGFVFPSCTRTEAYGIVLIEASMYGKPMITCEIGTGTSYINLDGETGIVVPPRNPEALAGAMEALWQNPALAQQYGQTAKLRYERHFTANQMMQSYAELYRKCLQNGTAPGL
ncbi:glycosyltransferase family 4 protein [Advenella mimigardefordensis]|uniref:Putative glycosyltransferase n=1 Tax=Advenella mimigardefordensis (strain DSM 17166 / LMG 22922 / DPN7) TaxID=1247726 RepID=W0PCP2_ADVMD|nr:glycosyltransferase family 4 protein [Advenella mimigardefordensis]AHG62788.1 putative glycosyltransferase [Advenella mimigardefordensis DPN7]